MADILGVTWQAIKTWWISKLLCYAGSVLVQASFILVELVSEMLPTGWAIGLCSLIRRLSKICCVRFLSASRNELAVTKFCQVFQHCKNPTNPISYTFLFYKKQFLRKWGSNVHNLKNLKENHQAEFPYIIVFIGQKSMFRRYCIHIVKDGIQIQVYNINSESVNHFIQCISVKLKKA